MLKNNHEFFQTLENPVKKKTWTGQKRLFFHIQECLTVSMARSTGIRRAEGQKDEGKRERENEREAKVSIKTQLIF